MQIGLSRAAACGLVAACSAFAQDCTPELASVHQPWGAFGASLAASEQLLFVGAPERDVPGPAGSVYPYGRAEVFEYDASAVVWRSLGVLAPSPAPLPAPNQPGFASALAYSEGTLFCTWPNDITGGNGTVRPFLRTAGGWVEESPILPPQPSATGRFGISVAADGPFTVIGEGISDGRAHIATRTGVLGWRTVQTLSPSFPQQGTFGWSVAIEGEWVFVGDPGNPAALSGRGSVEVFRRDAQGVWRFVQRLSGTGPAINDHFGLALAADAGRLVVGDDIAPSLIGSPGAAYVFELDSATGLWTQRARLTSPLPASPIGFATELALRGDALLVGSPNEPLGAAPEAGAAHLFRRDPVTGQWGHVRRFTHEPATPGAVSGSAVALGAWHAALGAPGVQRVRVVPADPARDVDADGALDACEALFLPTPCPALPNAAGRVGRIHVDGSVDVTAADLRLAADQLTPNSLGYFLVSRTFDVSPPAAPIGQLCLGGAIGRILTVLDAGAAGRVHLTIDPLVLPTPTGPVSALPGEVWHFQYWHRDLVAVTQRVSAFTEAARVLFR